MDDRGDTLLTGADVGDYGGNGSVCVCVCMRDTMGEKHTHGFFGEFMRKRQRLRKW